MRTKRYNLSYSLVFGVIGAGGVGSPPQARRDAILEMAARIEAARRGDDRAARYTPRTAQIARMAADYFTHGGNPAPAARTTNDAATASSLPASAFWQSLAALGGQ